jgi:hypothetical protein
MYDQWQAQQRAEKEAQRKKKTESAQMLTQFRGGVSEKDSKMAQMKEEERRKQKESKEMLQGYRGGVSEGDVKMAQMKEEDRKKQKESKDMLQGYRRGGLSEEETKLADIRKEHRAQQEDSTRLLQSYQCTKVDGIKERTVKEDPQHPIPPVTPKMEADMRSMILEGFVSSKAAGFDSPNSHIPMPTAPITGDPSSSNPTFADNQDESAVVNDLCSTMQEVFEEKKDESEAKLDTDDKPSLEVLTMQDQPSEVHSFNPMPESSNYEAFAPAPESSKVVEIADDSRPTIARLDVSFSFGLLTSTYSPILDSYMLAVERIVKTFLAANPETQEHVYFDPSCSPFIISREWDESYADNLGRSDVKRVLVTAAVPVFLVNDDADGPRRDILSLLQEAIKSGEFRSIAKDITN